MFSRVLMAATFETWRVMQHRMVAILLSDNTVVSLISQWLGTLMGIAAKHFMSVYGSHSGRSESASAAANANVPI
jgi:hypothetical protein